MENLKKMIQIIRKNHVVCFARNFNGKYFRSSKKYWTFEKVICIFHVNMGNIKSERTKAMKDLKITKIINDINRLIKTQYTSYVGAYIYGSRVKGNFSENSDIDIVLTFNRNIDWKEKNKIYGLINSYEVENDVIIDVHIYNLQDILEPATPYRYNVKNEGIFYEV